MHMIHTNPRASNLAPSRSNPELNPIQPESRVVNLQLLEQHRGPLSQTFLSEVSLDFLRDLGSTCVFMLALVALSFARESQTVRDRANVLLFQKTMLSKS